MRIALEVSKVDREGIPPLLESVEKWEVLSPNMEVIFAEVAQAVHWARKHGEHDTRISVEITVSEGELNGTS